MRGLNPIVVVVVALLAGCAGSPFTEAPGEDTGSLLPDPGASGGTSGASSDGGDAGNGGTSGAGVGGGPPPPPPVRLCMPPEYEPNRCGGCEDCTQLPGVDPDAVTCGDSATCVIADACAPGFADCDGETVNGCETLLNTPGSCGSCENDCLAQAAGLPNVTASATDCGEGSCEIQCAPGFADCNGQLEDGCEVDVSTPENCGGCGEACASSFVCVSQMDTFTCESKCPAGQEDCDGSCADLESSGSHCSACNNRCDAPTNAAVACVAGRCEFTGCIDGFGNCDGSEANGCEADLRASAENCGSCGNQCDFPGAGALCTDGTCKPGACENGRGNCDKQEPNGCEVTFANAARHCGACGNDCFKAARVSDAVCTRSTCRIRQCKKGYDNCDNKWNNGCESALNFRRTCGSCNNNCEKLPSVNQTRCDDNKFVCLIDKCDARRGNCDGKVNNGCETNLSNSESHCGKCGQRCKAPAGGSTSCVSGTCRPSCPSGASVCGGACVNTATDQNHCGACNQECDASKTCRAGSCTPTCDTGQLCGGVCVDTGTDENNCGACGERCETGETCNGGACSLDCSPGTQACGGVCVNTDTDENNCGDCGERCETGETCNNGSCTLSCGAGEQVCNGACVDIRNDENNCGMCDRVCEQRAGDAGGPSCVNGTCLQ